MSGNLTLKAARPPVALGDLKPVLDHALASSIRDGLLSERIGGGLIIGVVEHGERRIFAYGTAKRDSVFEIGSITKTFTGLLLAQMAVQKKLALTEPVRELLPVGFAGESTGSEITLLDLATQHSGLPRDPDNLAPANSSNPYVDYGAQRLSEFLRTRGTAKPANAGSLYSNVGFGLLGYALSIRAGIPYASLVHDEITAPLGMRDTVVALSAEQRKRLIQGYDASFNRADPWDFDVIAGAGALRSTASDMLTYLDANLHPENYATGSAPGSLAETLPAAIALDHQPRADAPELGAKIALAWFIDPKPPHWLDHNGGTGGYGSFARFCPDQDWAVIVLYNRVDPDPRFVDRVGVTVSAMLSGQPSISLDSTDTDQSALARSGVWGTGARLRSLIFNR